MAAPKEKEAKFDQRVLQGMSEPLSIRLEKLRGTVRQPIELPAKGNDQTGYHPPGTNWTRDEVLQLENFILTKWSGGGHYEFTVTDAKNESMRWSGVWDPRIYPERVPPNTAEAAVVGNTTGTLVGPSVVPTTSLPLGQATQTGWPPSAAQLGYGNPPFTGPVLVQAQPQAQAPQPPATPTNQPIPASQAPPMWAPGFGQYPGVQPHPMWTGFPPNNQYPFPHNNTYSTGYSPRPPRMYYDEDGYPIARPLTSSSRRNHQDDEEKKQLEQKLKEAELHRKELEYQSALERIQQQQSQQMQQLHQQHEQQMTAMREELRRLAESRNRGEDDTVVKMREEQARIREQAQAEQAQLKQQIVEQQLAQMRASYEAQTNALKDQLARLVDSPRESEDLRRLREDQDRQSREFERLRLEDQRRVEAERHERERERERFEQQRREDAIQREMKEAREATERRFEQLMNARNASDPMIDAMKETARMNAEQMREMARLQQANSDKMAAFMTTPLQLAQMMKDNSQGTDGVVRGMIQSISEIGNLYKNAAQSVLEMSGGGGDPPAARLIQEGMSRASEVAERFLSAKRDQAVSEAKVKTAEAQRDQMKIQAEAQLRAMSMQKQWAAPPPVANGSGGGLNGASQAQAQAAQAKPQPKTKQTGPIDLPDQPPSVEAAKSNGPIELTQDQIGGPPPRNNTGPTEEEVFGVALESVNRLRKGVAEGSLTPEKTINAILQGVNHVVANNITIPAFTLFLQSRWSDFIDIVLPKADQAFKDECVRILVEEVEHAGDDPEDGEDD